jgi:hypothetical protein
MSAATNSGAAAVQDSLLGLAARLVNPIDRESYAELVWWLRSLPPNDEIVKLAQFFGFLTLLTRQLPDMLIGEAQKLHELSETNARYHEALQQRLGQLPAEITAGINLEEFAGVMSERFRQQIAETGLEETADLLESCVIGLKRLSGELARSVQPLVKDYAGIGETVAAQLKKLTEASTELRNHNAQLVAQAAEERWVRRALLYLAIGLLGLFIGFSLEKRNTTDAVAELTAEVDQIQQKLGAHATPPPIQQRQKRIPK